MDLIILTLTTVIASMWVLWMFFEDWIRERKSVAAEDDVYRRRIALVKAGELEHQMKMLPHSDPDIIANCTACTIPRVSLHISPPYLTGGVMTPNEARALGYRDSRSEQGL